MAIILNEYRVRTESPLLCFGASRRLDFPKILALPDGAFRDFYTELMSERYGGSARPLDQLFLCDGCGHNIACLDEIREFGGRPFHPACSRERYALLTREAAASVEKKLSSDQMRYLRRVSELRSLR